MCLDLIRFVAFDLGVLRLSLRKGTKFDGEVDRIVSVWEGREVGKFSGQQIPQNGLEKGRSEIKN